MPGATGTRRAPAPAEGPPTRPGVIMMTAYSTANEAIQAIQAGAYDYLAKPFNLDEVAADASARWFEQRSWSGNSTRHDDGAPRRPRRRTSASSATARRCARSTSSSAESPPPRRPSSSPARRAPARNWSPRCIHKNSTYARGPLVKVNCAALPETLLESELFGHEKGAFTGAIAQRKGRFELAHKGTIFLDEIGEMSPSTQKKLLRVLAGARVRAGRRRRPRSRSTRA